MKGADVYFLRHILHNWPDESARKILNQARLAAGPHSKLVLAEYVISHAVPSKLRSVGEQESASSSSYPLLENLGAVSFPAVGMDLQVRTAFNSFLFILLRLCVDDDLVQRTRAHCWSVHAACGRDWMGAGYHQSQFGQSAINACIQCSIGLIDAL